jgi:flagellar protein FlgJ
VTSPLAPVGGVAATGPAGAAHDPRAQLRAAAQQFEAVFLRQMIGSMRQAKLADDPLDSAATDQFRDMADARLADSMSRQGVFGIAQMLIQQFEHRLGAAPAAGQPAATGAPSDGAQS